MPGYPNKWRDRLQGFDAKFSCSFCALLLHEPRQTVCGHRYCTSCVDKITREHGERFTCRVKTCEQRIYIREVFPDKAIEREMLAVTMFCTNAETGCEWEGPLQDVKEHVEECDFQQVACIHDGCTEKILRKNLPTHLIDSCVFRLEACGWCNDEFPFRDIKEHNTSCLLAPARCELCGKEGFTNAQLKKHQDPENGYCKNLQQPCNFSSAGCKEMVEKDKLKDHQTSSLPKHLNMTLAFVQQLASNFEQHREIQVEAHENLRSLLPKTDKRVKELNSKVTELEKKMEGEIPNVPGTLKSLDGRLEQVTTKAKELQKKESSLDTRVSTFEGIVAVLNREIESCSAQLDTYERQRRHDREALEIAQRRITSLERIIGLKDAALAEQDLRIQTLELASYDGILTWKIPDFTRKRHNAITGKIASFYSPCFFTSRTGYKMCARIYLNGDGMGKGTHVSLFFVVMRGHYDGLLRWPFRQKVTFMLLDQNNREHVIDAFRPDPTSSSFQRPTSDMNIASGCPLFVPLSQLESSSHAYVRDDTMFIRVVVDTSDLN